MRVIKYSFWISLAVLTALWLVAEPRAFAPDNFFAFRSVMMQYTGILAIGCMSLAMMLSLRPTMARAVVWRLGQDVPSA